MTIDNELTQLARGYLGPDVEVLTADQDGHFVLILRQGETAVAAPMHQDPSWSFKCFALGRLTCDLQIATGKFPSLIGPLKGA